MLKGKIEFYNSNNNIIKSTSSNEFHASFNSQLMSYCPQIPIIHSGTVQSNILMGSDLDKNRFNEIVQGCCLKRDIEKNWPRGEYTEVGNAGSSLSGGQKLRIGVARALYSSTSIVRIFFNIKFSLFIIFLYFYRCY
jgi:ABC-type transport system involved in cytochrome bd biosynthesis fused ATPase/permease subunit